MKRHVKLYLTMTCVLCLSTSAATGSSDSLSYSKHTIDINFLRITDFEASTYRDEIKNGFSTFPGITYQYHLSPSFTVRVAINKDRKNYEYRRWFSETYSSITYHVGFQLKLKSKPKAPLYLFLDGYGKAGSGHSLYGDRNDLFIPIIPRQVRQVYTTYRFKEYGCQIGIGKTYRLTKSISWTLESNIMFGEQHKTNTITNRKLIYKLPLFNPVSRFSINYTINPKKSRL
ncbi:MAG: hypothetical protein ACI9JN_002031 [Bacteroidia bacterium]|jgi:hypothetical protein